MLTPTKAHKDATNISTIANSLRDRANPGPDGLSPQDAAWFRALKQATFVKDLWTPRFIIQSQMHPYAYGAPGYGGTARLSQFGRLLARSVSRSRRDHSQCRQRNKSFDGIGQDSAWLRRSR